MNLFTFFLRVWLPLFVVAMLPLFVVSIGWLEWSLIAVLFASVATLLAWNERQKVISGVNEFLLDLSDGEQLFVSKRTNELPISETLNNVLATCDEQVSAVAASASRVIPIARELADSYMMIHQKSQMQNQYGNVVAQNVREMESMRSEVHEQNLLIGSAVNGMVNTVEHSHVTIKATESSMRELAASTKQTVDQISVLSNVNSEILGIAQSITDIAESTNLLALNAAIEAARAGEHGRGFAVVADEVRRLSQQTQEATAKIRAMADSISGETGKTIDQIGQNREDAESTMAKMQEATTDLDSILSSVNEIQDLSTVIGDAMEKQESVSSQASENVTALVDLNSNVVSANQTHAVSESDLCKLGDFIHSKLLKFHLTNDTWDTSLRPNKNEGNSNSEVAMEIGDQPSDESDVELF